MFHSVPIDLWMRIGTINANDLSFIAYTIFHQNRKKITHFPFASFSSTKLCDEWWTCLQSRVLCRYELYCKWLTNDVQHHPHQSIAINWKFNRTSLFSYAGRHYSDVIQASSCISDSIRWWRRRRWAMNAFYINFEKNLTNDCCFFSIFVYE